MKNSIMLKKLKIFFLLLSFLPFTLATKDVLAIEDPLSVPNNIFGIHIHDEKDLLNASKLVNSSGGDWGYVTLVIREDERDLNRWQKAFDEMRRLHLIPIVRIATKQIGGIWEAPSFDGIKDWVLFLNKLNWVVKNRYVVIGNEPNHSKEWGGKISPEEYSDYLYEFSKKLKNVSEEFFILPAGFDASAPNSKETMDEEEFIEKMLSHNPKVFEFVDGWASHSYPNSSNKSLKENFERGTTFTFKWEKKLLKRLGVEKEFPIFITETGWINEKPEDEKKISEKIIKAFNSEWKDEKIVAVTPFILNYKYEPFNIFSWTKPDGGFYDFYYTLQNLTKVKGKPKQHNRVDVVGLIFPPIIPTNGKLAGISYIKNEGQTIWEKKQNFIIQKGRIFAEVEPIFFLSKIEPGQGSFAIIKIFF